MECQWVLQGVSSGDMMQADPTTDWRTLTIPWYGGANKEVETATGV